MRFSVSSWRSFSRSFCIHLRCFIEEKFSIRAVIYSCDIEIEMQHPIVHSNQKSDFPKYALQMVI